MQKCWGTEGGITGIDFFPHKKDLKRLTTIMVKMKMNSKSDYYDDLPIAKELSPPSLG